MYSLKMDRLLMHFSRYSSGVPWSPRDGTVLAAGEMDLYLGVSRVKLEFYNGDCS